MAGIIQNTDNVNLYNELLFEQVRAQHFPSFVSRLKCLYAFENKILAEAARVWNLQHFVPDNLAEVIIEANNFTKVDVNWIEAIFKRKNGGLYKEEDIPDIMNYWRGQPYNDDPLWELLIDGTAIILGKHHEEKAYKTIKSTMPDSLGLLELARIAGVLGFSLGHIKPQVRRVGPSTFTLTHMMDSKDLRDLHDNCGTLIETLEKTRIPVREDAMRLLDVNGHFKFNTPDFREHDRTFTVSPQNVYGLKTLKLHAL